MMRRHLSIAALALAALALTASVALGSVQVPTSGWVWGNPKPQGNALRDMGFAGTRGYAAGDDGTILRTDDLGATWKGLATGTTASFQRLQVVDANTVVALDASGCSLRMSTDAGATFRRIYTPTDLGCPSPVAFATFVSAQVGYVVLRDGSVLRTADGGHTFSKQTSLPGTASSATPGGAVAPVDGVFSTADAGMVVVRQGAAAAAYTTVDQGHSWTAVAALPDGVIAGPRRLRVVAPGTLALVADREVDVTTDGGATFARHAFPGPEVLTDIACAAPDRCLLTVLGGRALLRTSDFGTKTVRVTASTSAIDAVAFASPTRVVGLGDGGTTVISADVGATFFPLGGALAGTFTALRPGASAMQAYALGAHGEIARTIDGGVVWSTISVPTAAGIVDTAFPGAGVGYALDAGGGLFRTANDGASWQTLDPGTEHPRGLATLGGDAVAVVDRTGLRRQVGDGRFTRVTDRDVAGKTFYGVDVNRSSAVAYGPRALVVTRDHGATWSRIPLPQIGPARKRSAVVVRRADFIDARNGWLLDTAGRVWFTGDGRYGWKRDDAVGAGRVLDLSVGSGRTAYLTVDSFGAERSHAYVLAGTAGAWAPQRLTLGRLGIGSLLAVTDRRAYALVQGPGAPTATQRLLFTTTGGFAGRESELTIRTAHRTITKKALHAAGDAVTIQGRLAGATGGEQIVVSGRNGATGVWTQRVVTAGANDGSFTARLPGITSTSTFVAQWAGDSGRRGAGTLPLTVKVK